MNRILTVGDIRKVLKSYSDDMPVLVDGYEEGFSEIQKVALLNLKLSKDPEKWEGKFEYGKVNDKAYIVFKR